MNKKFNKKLFVFDMDGTILDSNEKLPQKTKEALQLARKAGHKIAIATGRSYKDAIRDLKENDSLFDYFILNNGSYLLENNKKSFQYFGSVHKDVVKAAKEKGIETNSFLAIHCAEGSFRCFLGDVPVWDEKEFEEFKKFKDQLLEPLNLENWLSGKKIFQVSLRNTKKHILEMKNSFDNILNLCDMHISNEVYIDFNPKGINKWTGVQNVIKELKILESDVISFGDSGNDIDLLKNSGLGFAMSNGTKSAKEVANEVIGSNDSFSVSETIFKYI